MKKLSLTFFSVVVALCFVLGIALMTNTATAKAEAVAGTTPTFSATKYKISTEKNGMLIATGIKDCQDVYEVGYTFDSEVTTVKNTTGKYYTSIRSGDNVWEVADLFGDTYTGMIVWEIEYDRATSYTYTAYAKVGSRDGSGNLGYDTQNEIIVNGTSRTTAAEQYTVTVVTNNAYGSVDEDSVTKVYGSSISVSGNILTVGGTNVTATANASDGDYYYKFEGWTGVVATLTGNITITANFARYAAKTSFDFESASDINYVSVAAGTASIIDKTSVTKGANIASCDDTGTYGDMSGKVLKVTNSQNTITIHLGKTVAAGSTVSFSFALTAPEIMDSCVGNNSANVKINGQEYSYWHACGVYRNSSVTLAASADALTITVDTTNLGIIGAFNTANVEIYFDNLVVTEPLPAKTSFDFSGARDLEYVSITAGTKSIIDKADIIKGANIERCDDTGTYGDMSGKVLKVTDCTNTITIDLGKMVAAGSTVSFSFAFTAPEIMDACNNGNGYMWVAFNAQSYAYWHACGVYRNSSVILPTATDKIVITFDVSPLSTIGTFNTANVEIYFDNIVVTEP